MSRELPRAFDDCARNHWPKTQTCSATRHSPEGYIVSKTVGRNGFLGQRGLLCARSSNVLFKNVFEPRPGHCLVMGVQKQRCATWLAANFEPIATRNRCFFP